MNTIFPVQLFNTKLANPDFSKFVFNMKNTFINKPCNALWTSSLIYYFGLNDDSEKFPVSSWLMWCIYEDFRVHEHTFIVHPKPNLKVFELNDDNISELPLTDGTEQGFINFAKLKIQGYDGFHLTEKMLYKYKYELFSAWDVESTCWFNTSWIDSIEEIPNYKDRLINHFKNK